MSVDHKPNHYRTRWGSKVPRDPVQPWEKQLPGEKWISLGILLFVSGMVWVSTYSPSAVELRNQHWCDTRECVTDYRLNQP